MEVSNIEQPSDSVIIIVKSHCFVDTCGYVSIMRRRGTAKQTLRASMCQGREPHKLSDGGVLGPQKYEQNIPFST